MGTLMHQRYQRDRLREQREREAQRRRPPRRQRLTVAQVEAQQRENQQRRLEEQQRMAAEARRRAQERRDARLLLEAVEANRRFEIDHIVERRVNEDAKEYEYKIRWKGFGEGKDLWLLRSKLERDGVGEVLDNYDRSAALLERVDESSSEDDGMFISSEDDRMYHTSDDDDDDLEADVRDAASTLRGFRRPMPKRVSELSPDTQAMCALRF